MKRLHALPLVVMLAAAALPLRGADEASGANSASAAEDPTAGEATAAVDLAPLIERIEALETSLTDAQERAAGESRALSESLAELKSGLADLREAIAARPRAPANTTDTHTARALEQIQTRVGGLERLLVTSGNSADTAFAYPRLAAILSGVAALLALVVVVGIFWVRPGGGARSAVPGSVTRRLEEIHKAVGALSSNAHSGGGAGEGSGGARPAADVAGTLVQTANALRTATEKAARDQKELADIVAQFQAVSSGLQPALDALGARVAEIEQARSTLGDERATFEREKADLAARAEAGAAEKQRAAGEISAAQERLKAAESRLAGYDALWPEAFHGNGPLAAAKDRVLAALNGGRPEAGDLYSALLRWYMVRSVADKDREQWIDAADAVGRASHAFLAKESGDGLTPAEQLERAQLWTRSIKTPLEQTFPELKLNGVYPGDRFDTDRMESVGSVSGGRQTVHRALSWMILEKTAESTRVVRRAQVITA